MLTDFYVSGHLRKCLVMLAVIFTFYCVNCEKFLTENAVNAEQIDQKVKITKENNPVEKVTEPEKINQTVETAAKSTKSSQVKAVIEFVEGLRFPEVTERRTRKRISEWSTFKVPVLKNDGATYEVTMYSADIEVTTSNNLTDNQVSKTVYKRGFIFNKKTKTVWFGSYFKTHPSAAFIDVDDKIWLYICLNGVSFLHYSFDVSHFSQEALEPTNENLDKLADIFSREIPTPYLVASLMPITEGVYGIFPLHFGKISAEKDGTFRVDLVPDPTKKGTPEGVFWFDLNGRAITKVGGRIFRPVGPPVMLPWHRVNVQ
jgi:hypothetical protein